MHKFVTLVLSAAVIFTAADNSFAQSYSLVPNDTINLTGMLEDLETLTIQQQNLTSDTLQLNWKKVSESLPAFWEVSICDNSICYTTLVDSGAMNPVYPGDYGLLLLHITARINYGTAVVRYAVWDITNLNLKDTLTYILTVNAPSVIAEIENKNIVSFFPNPATENIHLIFSGNKQDRFEIRNTAGQILNSGEAIGSYTLSLTGWNEGLYTVSVFNGNKIIAIKKFLVQQ